MTQSVPSNKKPPSARGRLTKQLAGIMAHLERHPQDGLSRARVETIKKLLAEEET